MAGGGGPPGRRPDQIMVPEPATWLAEVGPPGRRPDQIMVALLDLEQTPWTRVGTWVLTPQRRRAQRAYAHALSEVTVDPSVSSSGNTGVGFRPVVAS